MNREVHVRFWESAGLQCPAPLDYLRDYLRVPDARTGISNWFRYYNHERHHQGLDYLTPAALYRQGAAR